MSDLIFANFSDISKTPLEKVEHESQLDIHHFIFIFISLKQEKCTKKISINREEFCQYDQSQISLVPPAAPLAVVDDELSFHTSSQSSCEEYVDGRVTKYSKLQHSSRPGKENQNENIVNEQHLNELTKKPNEQIKKLRKDDVQQQSSKSFFDQKPLRTKKNDIKLKQKNASVSKQMFLAEEEAHDVNVDALFKNGNRYQGRLSCYLMEGEATYKWSDGTTYQGTFTDGIAKGLGLIKWPDGSWYDGEMKNNRRHGRGISVYKQNNQPKMCYFGNWRNGKTNGKGMLIYGENDWYDGYWKKGRHDGFGLRQYPSGSRFLGEWKDGREHGWGTMVWSNQDVYTGSWVNGKMEGKGTYAWRCVKSNNFVHPMQNTYIGQWKNGKRHGHGSLLLASGAVVHAFWVDGIKDGPGQIICKNGIVIKSAELFKDDKVYKLDSPIMIPFWNTWYCEFLSSYRSGLFYVQKLEEEEKEGERKVGEETPDKYNECSNNIPIFAPVESLPLWDFVLKAVCQPIPDLMGEISYIIRTEDVELLSSEEMWLRKVITNRMADITCLYQHYATIACDKKPPFKACMFRIMLWQMCRDCGLEKTRFNLCQLDSEAGCDNYPFAIILVFQMIHYLLILAYEICVKQRQANTSIPGRWGGAFDYFLTNYALPGMQNTNRIPELCNTIPLRNVFCLYESIGKPVTVGKILENLLSDDEPGTTQGKPKIKISDKINGQNKIYPDGRIVFEESGGTLLGTIFDYEEPKSKYFDLNEIKLLGKCELAWNLFYVCPKAKKDNIPNRDYEVSFLEFCEFIKIALRKYQAILNPDAEISLVTTLAKCDDCNRWVELEHHYEVEHDGKPTNKEEVKETSTEDSSFSLDSTTSSKENDELPSIDESCNGQSYTFGDEGLENASTSEVKDTTEPEIVGKGPICPCKDSKYPSLDENSGTKICKCQSYCECSCNEIISPKDTESFDVIELHDKESSIISSGVPFKDAKTITLTACDSDCQCFCHEKHVFHNDEKADEESEYSPFEDANLEAEDLEESDVDTASSIKLSDAINFLCDKTSDEEGEGEIEQNLESYSEGESASETTDLFDSDLEEGEYDAEDRSSEEEEHLLAGEDFMASTKKFLSELEQIEATKEGGDIHKVCEKLLQFNCPQFKIKYSEFFKNVSVSGMTPKELREQLRLDRPEDLLAFEEQDIEDIEKELIDESLKVISIVAKQRIYEKLLIGQFKNTISQIETGEYWENFVDKEECDCTCKNCIAGVCQKVKKKIKFAVEDDEYEISSDSSVTIDNFK